MEKSDGGKKKMILGRGVEKVIDFIGEILAIAAIILILTLYINGKVNFIGEESLPKLAFIREFLIITVIGLKALEFALKRGIILAAICLAIIIATYVLVFIPNTVPGWTFNGFGQIFGFLS